MFILYLVLTPIMWGLPCITGEDALVAFDCRHPKAEISTVSLVSPPPCNTPMTSTGTAREVNIQLIQKRDSYPMDYFQCKVERKMFIYQCGVFTDYQTGVPENYIEEILIVSSEECDSMHRTKRYISPSSTIIDGLIVNQTIKSHELVAGSINHEGDCTGEDWRYGSSSYTRVVVQAYYTIGLYEGTASLDINTNTLIFPGGVACDFDKMGRNCVHPIYGPSYWGGLPQDCFSSGWVVIYQGFANLTSSGEGITLTSNAHTHAFALETTGISYVCSHKVYKTMHASLFAIILDGAYSPFPHLAHVPSTEVDYTMYVNSKFVYFDNAVRSNFLNLDHVFRQHRCEINRRVVLNLQSTAYSSGSAFAYNLKGSSGYTAEIRGEVAHVISCVPVPVYYKPQKGCSLETPISYQNRTYYITPRNRILVTYATEVDCSPLLPVMYYLGDSWYTIFPYPMVTKNPDTISLDINDTFKYRSPLGLAEGGIYTKETLEEYQHTVIFGQEQIALTNTLARGYSGVIMTHKQGSLKGLLDEASINEMKDKLSSRLWSVVTNFSTIGAAVFGVMTMWTIFVKILNMIVSAYESYCHFGVTWRLFLCWWTSLSHYLVFTQAIKRNQENTPASEEQVEQIPLTKVDSHSVSPNAPYLPLYPHVGNA